MSNETINLIMGRRSVRSYKQDPIEEEKMKVILEAALYAPNGGGRQLWNFTVVQNRELMDDMVKKMVQIMSASDNPNLQKKAADPNYHTFYHAPAIIIVSGAENAPMIIADCAAATENMIIAAESLGLNTCWIGSAELVLAQDDVKKALGIPEGYKPFYAVSVGYGKDVEKLAPMPRKDNLVHYIK